MGRPGRPRARLRAKRYGGQAAAERLERGVLGAEGRRQALHVPQAEERAQSGRASASRALPRARLVDLRAPDVRSHRAGQGRVLADERVRRLRLRRLDDGLRGLRTIDAHRAELGHRGGRQGSESRHRSRHEGDRAAPLPFLRRVVRRIARRRVRDGLSGSRGPSRARGVHLHGRRITDARRPRQAAGVLQDAQPPPARSRHDSQHLHPRQSGHLRHRRGRGARRRRAAVWRQRADGHLSRHDGKPAGRRSVEGARAGAARPR